MKLLAHLLAALAFSFGIVAARAGEPPAKAARPTDAATIKAVRAADDARVKATIGADAGALGALLSDELRYTHSSGSVDTKEVFINALTTGRVRYLAINYEERVFEIIAPGVALMSGRGRFKPAPRGGQPLDLHLSFLAVWRQENGQWRFLAWQSARIPAAAAKK